MSFETIIVIGAPRSGTNMLRDVMCRLPGFGTWPCDEINYIWRHGNARWPSDEFPADLATPVVSAYLREQFARRARADRLSYLVEKTCANSLRVPFVERALPDARYLFIYRDPHDAIPSAMKRWRAPLELNYTLRKARFVPFTDVPYYGGRFLKNRVHRLFSREKKVATWGPRFTGMEELARVEPLLEICARQWNACVSSAATAFRDMPPAKCHVVGYEDFVTDPEAGVKAICAFLGATPGSSDVTAAVESVSDRSIGKGRGALDGPARDTVESLTASGLAAASRLAASRGS